jgi:hypothetical protein
MVFRLALPLAECGLIVGVAGLWFSLLSDATRMYLTLTVVAVATCAASAAKWVQRNGMFSLLPQKSQQALMQT